MGEVEERKKEKRVVGKDGEKGGRSERKRTEGIRGMKGGRESTLTKGEGRFEKKEEEKEQKEKERVKIWEKFRTEERKEN